MIGVDLDDLARRPQRYWNVDGLPELVMGVLWMTWGAAFLIGTSLPHDWRQIYWLVVPPTLASSAFAAAWVTRKLKARLTFPRTGYVEWTGPAEAGRLRAAAMAIVSAAILAAAAVVLKNGSRTEQLVAPAMALVLSLAFVVASIRQRAPHLLALAGVAAALAIALGSVRASWETLNWVFVLVGLASAVLGACRLALFLRKHPRAPLEGA